MSRTKAAFTLLTCLWCHPLLTAFIWGATTYLGGGLLCAYLLGVRPNGILVWSDKGLHNNAPPGDAPLYVQTGTHKGLIYFAQLGDLGITSNNEGWYTLPQSMPEFRPDWFGQASSVTIPAKVRSPEHLYLGNVELYLLSTENVATQPSRTVLELEYMFQHGQQYRVVQEHRNGAVRPVSIMTIPDSMPMLTGAVCTTVAYTIIAAAPSIIYGITWIQKKQ